MKIVLFCICVFCICASLLAETNTNYLSADDVMQGFKLYSNSGRREHQKWLADIYGKSTMLTNEAERITLAKELVEILNSEKSSNQDKCAAAYLIGLFRLEEGIKALINNFILGNEEALNPDSIQLAEREIPACHALVLIGDPAIPEVMGLIESTTDSYTLKHGAEVVLFIKGQDDGAEFLKQAIDSQTDRKKKENLQAALSSEYFTDPKYRFSGPEEKVKRMLAQQILPAQVRLKPEVLEISPGVLTAFVRLPEEYPVKNITSATCDGAFYEKMILNDDETEMIVKFRRQDIESALARIGKSIDTNFVVRGIWRGAAGTNFFEGESSIKKIVGEKQKK